MAPLYTILVDEREKRPLPIPSSLTLGGHPGSPRLRTALIHVRKTRLLYGDYCLESHPNHAVIERKASLDEIATNCLNPARREAFLREFTRLTTLVRRPLFLFEGDPHSLSRPTRHNPQPAVALDAFQTLLLSHNIPCLFLPTSTTSHLRSIGEWCARWLINASLLGDSPCPPPLASPPTAPSTSTTPAPSNAAGSSSPSASPSASSWVP